MSNPLICYLSFTGDIHLGGLRTALYNYLFARSNNGLSLLRIEDTDQTRTIPGAKERLIDDLKWFGIQYDDEPIIQSQRTEIYKQHANMLLENGAAYRCFCSETRLNLAKKEAVKSGGRPNYDNKCRNLSDLEIKDKLDKGETYCVRLKVMVQQ